MHLLETIAADLKTAMLARDVKTTGTLRLLKAEIQKAEITAGEGFNEEGVLQVIRREVKKRAEAAESYKSVGNLERVAEEESEAEYLRRYLPAAATQADIEAFIASIKDSAANKGEIIKKTVEHFKGTADGRAVAETVNRLA